MEAGTSGSKEITHIISVVAIVRRKNQHNNPSNSTSGSYFVINVVIRQGVMWGNV